MRGGEYKGWERKSFGSFVKIVLGQARRKQDVEYLGIDAHWRPFNAHCFFCNVKYTVISKMETYDEDRNRFLKMVGIEEEIEEERMHVHAGDSIQDVTKLLFQEIPKKDREEIEKLYKFDLELFDYDPDLY